MRLDPITALRAAGPPRADRSPYFHLESKKSAIRCCGKGPNGADGFEAARTRSASVCVLRAAGTRSLRAHRNDPAAAMGFSARAPRRAIARQWTRAHAKARRERWRHVVERGAAIAANFLRRVLHAEPVAAG